MSHVGRVALVVGGLLVGMPDDAQAQKKKAARPAAARVEKAQAKAAAPAPAPASEEPQAKLERTAGGGKIIRLTPILVEGKVQKPLALVLARSAIQYDWEQLKHDFTPKIVEAVSRHPF